MTGHSCGGDDSPQGRTWEIRGVTLLRSSQSRGYFAFGRQQRRKG